MHMLKYIIQRAQAPCADPESFLRGDPNLIFCFVLKLMRTERIKIPLKADHHRSASETPFNGVSLAGR